MSRLIGTAILATAFAAVGVHAQDTTVKTTTKTEGGGKTITYTGCVQTAPETRSFTLDHIVPVSRTTVTEAPGANGAAETTTTTTKYVLVPGPTVQFQQFVGHKVEVTGMIVPAGDSKTRTETKVERDHGPDTKTTETVKRDNSMAEFRVMSIKHLADSCTN